MGALQIGVGVLQHTPFMWRSGSSDSLGGPVAYFNLSITSITTLIDPLPVCLGNVPDLIWTPIVPGTLVCALAANGYCRWEFTRSSDLQHLN